ncbi:MAG: preprotein translocase subunit SecG [Candidatus Brocadiaceae bacterium]|jgi:preprotein translocase subunit SecG
MDPEEFRRQAKKGLIIACFFGAALLFYYLGWRVLLVVYLFVVAAVAMLAILMQRGRGGGLAGYLGGLGGDSLLGVHSASPIARATYAMLALFVFIAMLIARHDAVRKPTAGVLDAASPAQEAEAPEGVLPPAQPPRGTGEQLPPLEAPETTPPDRTGQDD